MVPGIGKGKRNVNLAPIYASYLRKEHKPIAFLSKALCLKNQSLCVYEKEFLAILPVAKWKHYLVVNYFIIRTDQQSLKHILEQKALETLVKILNMVPSKIMAWTPYEIWYGKLTSYKYLSEMLGLTNQLDNDPKTYTKAMSNIDSGKWVDAMRSKMDSMHSIKIWALVSYLKVFGPLGVDGSIKENLELMGGNDLQGLVSSERLHSKT
ncbi:UNVERIFIED_CONTAM: hypothetical protein Scaly_2184000 [Sesamum calycinum]|uniref:Reverse transcriptase RNase H-like domain-containing protein n=1 Tax=Sesamum calycinum TaxID=2727403 RepID=A0AAW2MNR1_9LAMI